MMRVNLIFTAVCCIPITTFGASDYFFSGNQNILFENTDPIIIHQIEATQRLADTSLITSNRTNKIRTEEADITTHAKKANTTLAQKPKKNVKPRKTRKKIVSNPDDKRPDDQFTTQIFGRKLTIGGEYELRAAQRRNYALSDMDNNRESYRQKLELEFKYDISKKIKALVETKLTSIADHRADRRNHMESLERGESWIDFNQPLNNETSIGLRIGRQNFAEKREWWWDEDLDGIRIYYASPKLSYEVGFTEALGGIAHNQPLSEDKNDIQRILGRIEWEYIKGHKLELFALNHNDQSSTPAIENVLSTDKEDVSDAQINWYGMRASGKDKIKDLGKIRYWADFAIVRGQEVLLDFDDINDEQIEVMDITEQSIRGTAFDVGVTLKSKLRGHPSFTLGLAQGSGDRNPDDNLDRSFRQTGINDNNGKFSGVDSFRYYGELLRPELSNLRISTASIGYPLRYSSSIEILYHRYDQLEASKKLSSRLRIRPSGQKTHIGDEIDIVVGLEEWEKIELEFVGSMFRAGSAFADQEGKRSYFIGAKANYNF